MSIIINKQVLDEDDVTTLRSKIIDKLSDEFLVPSKNRLKYVSEKCLEYLTKDLMKSYRSIGLTDEQLKNSNLISRLYLNFPELPNNIITDKFYPILSSKGGYKHIYLLDYKSSLSKDLAEILEENYKILLQKTKDYMDKRKYVIEKIFIGTSIKKLEFYYPEYYKIYLEEIYIPEYLKEIEQLKEIEKELKETIN